MSTCSKQKMVGNNIYHGGLLAIGPCKDDGSLISNIIRLKLTCMLA